MLISIITISYNDFSGLERTIKSVQDQTATNYEHILIDGGSSDGSKELMESCKNNFSFYSSEPDHGVYDAMNKGILKATGDYLLFLNSGDTLYKKDVLSKVQPYLNTSTAIVYGDLYIIGDDRPNFILRYPKSLDFIFFKNTSLGHPATFIKKKLFDVYGNYRTDLNIVSDWAFFLKTICEGNVSYKKIHMVVSSFYEGGISTAVNNIQNHKDERKKVLLEHYDLYDDHFNALLESHKENTSVYDVINPAIKVVTTNRFFRKILNSVIGLFAFVLKKKRSL
jgi:glycosyltransferase involved in cell wall biosynthesis